MLMNTSQAHPYAVAAFETAKASDTILEWSALLERAAVIAGDPQVHMLFNNPRVTRSQLADFFTELCFDSLNFGALDVDLGALNVKGKDFIQLLAEYRRLNLIGDIAFSFEQLVAEHKNILKAQVVSAYPLDENCQKDLVLALEKRFGQDIHLTYSTDKNLIGGLIIRVGDFVIDGSIHDKLIRLKESLLTAQ